VDGGVVRTAVRNPQQKSPVEDGFIEMYLSGGNWLSLSENPAALHISQVISKKKLTAPGGIVLGTETKRGIKPATTAGGIREHKNHPM